MPTQTQKSGHALSHFRNNKNSPNVVLGIQLLSHHQIFVFLTATVPTVYGRLGIIILIQKVKEKKTILFLFDFFHKRPLKQGQESAVSNHLITFLIFYRNILYHCTTCFSYVCFFCVNNQNGPADNSCYHQTTGLPYRSPFIITRDISSVH